MEPLHAQQLQRAAACVSARLRDAPEELDLLLDDFESPSQAADAFFLFADACVSAVSALSERRVTDVVGDLAHTDAATDASDPRLLSLGTRLVRAQVDDDQAERDAAVSEFADAAEAANAGFTIAFVAVHHLAEQTGRDPAGWASTFAVNAARIVDQ